MPNWRCRPRAAARPLATIASVVSAAGTSAKRDMGGDRHHPQARPGQHHRDQLARNAAALGDELGLAGMGEADRVEPALRHRAGDEPRSRAHLGEADRELQRVERVARLGEAGAAQGERGIGDIDDRQGVVERRGGGGGIADQGDRAVPDRLHAVDVADREERRQRLGAPPFPALGDHFGADAGRIAQRNGERGDHAASAIVDHRVAPKIAQIALGAHVDPLLHQRVRDLLRGLGALTGGGSSRPHRTRTLTRSGRAEGRRRLADAEVEQRSPAAARGRSRTRTWSFGHDLGADRLRRSPARRRSRPCSGCAPAACGRAPAPAAAWCRRDAGSTSASG